MANILQVTTSPVQTDHRPLTPSQEAKNQAENQRIQNPVDPTRVVRADGQQGGKTGTATGEGTFGIIDYESNYGAFVQNLNDSQGMAGLLEQVLFQNATGMTAEQTQLLDELKATLQMESGQELVNFFVDQSTLQAKFSGTLFDGLRNILTQNAPDQLKESVLSFLKSYNDYSAGTHLLSQMETLTGRIEQQMLGPFREEFRQEAALINWEAPNGETEQNAQVLNNNVIPFLSSYISKTHDYGAVRDSVMLFILNAVKYENGSESQMLKLFERVLGNREFPYYYQGDAQADLEQTMEAAQPQRKAGAAFVHAFAELLQKGSKGEMGPEQIQQYQNVFQNILLNESVYLPLLHLLVPFSYEGKDVMSEVWVDPDADKEQEGGRKIRMLLQFQIQRLGKFDMILEFQDWNVELQLAVPHFLQENAEAIQERVAGILKENGLRPSRLVVREKTGELRLQDVFPEVREKERTINVRI